MMTHIVSHFPSNASRAVRVNDSFILRDFGLFYPNCYSFVTSQEGRLNEAAELFGEVEEKVVLKSEWGGRSRLQRALCLDSLGRTEEAGQLYKLIRNHPQVDVAKRAKQMMFGIESMDFLKTHSISYGVGKEDYAGYFRRISSDWDTIYLPTSEEDEVSMRWQSAVAIMVMAAPLMTIAGVVLTK